MKYLLLLRNPYTFGGLVFLTLFLICATLIFSSWWLIALVLAGVGAVYAAPDRIIYGKPKVVLKK